jgi:hypothetical protein
MKWRQASGVLYDKRVPQKLKDNFYRTTIRPAMLYGLTLGLLRDAYPTTECRRGAYVVLDMWAYKIGPSKK